jgi:hypothetical protein
VVVIVLFLIGAASMFWTTITLRNFKVRNKPPASRAHLSLEERKQKFRMASWFAFGLGCFFVFGAILIAWLAHIRGPVLN